MTESRLGALAWPDVPAGALVVPVGSTEQHGPHLPVTTDTDIAEAIVDGLSERRPYVVVAPAAVLRVERGARRVPRDPVHRTGGHRAVPSGAGPIGGRLVRPLCWWCPPMGATPTR